MIYFILMAASISFAANTIECQDGTKILPVPNIPKEALCADYGGYTSEAERQRDAELESLIRRSEAEIERPDTEIPVRDSTKHKVNGNFDDPDRFKLAFWVEPIAFYRDYQDEGKEAPYLGGGIGFYGQAFYLNLGYNYYYGLDYYNTTDTIHGSSLSIGVAVPLVFRKGYSFQPFFGFKNHISRVFYEKEYLDYSAQAGFEVGLKGSYEHFCAEAGWVPGLKEMYRYRAGGRVEPHDFYTQGTKGFFAKFGTTF